MVSELSCSMIECDDFDLEPGFYLNLMHTLSIMALVMNLFAVYCVVCKSTKQMGVYKWYLLIYQAASTLFDFVYTSLTLPVIFFPVPMGYPGAWIAEWLSISSHAATITVILTCSMMAAAVLSLFNYRLFVVTPTHHFMRISDNGKSRYCYVIGQLFQLLVCDGLEHSPRFWRDSRVSSV
ncbi:unnamed protein product [Haemonchus placei]|uniref:7TM_GPCR_Srx domain-containing protein n=1 Tax=Haemonchus placei TaxID=6290 RepID=A0A0N4X4B9_HAEPC|nr:unnamed protein product [Haemonchus placei]